MVGKKSNRMSPGRNLIIKKKVPTPSAPSVSRNYNENRDRLRQLLWKKKAKICKCFSTHNLHGKSSSSSSSSSSLSSTSTLTSADSRLRSSSSSTTDPWSIEAAVEFIEGSQGVEKDAKKVEKKALQKQKKVAVIQFTNQKQVNENQASTQNQSQKKSKDYAKEGKGSDNSNQVTTAPGSFKAVQKTVQKQASNKQKERKEQDTAAQRCKENTIYIENLKLKEPGITIIKIDAPSKHPKQTMSGMLSSNYGNVIVFDPGRLKQDLTTKIYNDQWTTVSKKKKKTSAANGSDKTISNAATQPVNKNSTVKSARTVLNPATNMVTIRDPAFGTPPPKMDMNLQQQTAMMKVQDNGMVTIRGPALQRVINMVMQPPPKPDFVLKTRNVRELRTTGSSSGIMNSGDVSVSVMGSNGMPRLMLAQNEFINGLSSIHMSKVMNEVPSPANGPKSMTLTKIRNSPQQQYYEDNNSQNGTAGVPKSKNNGVCQLKKVWKDEELDSAFTPKDIDLQHKKLDPADRDVELLKRFCLESKPPAHRVKVHLNMKEIVIKNKSFGSSSTGSSAVTIAT